MTASPTPTVAPIKLSHLQEADLAKSLRAKVTRVLKDLSLDGPAANMPAIVGGKKQALPRANLSAPQEPRGGPII